MRDVFSSAQINELPTTEEEFLAFEKKKQAEVEEAKAHLSRVQKKASATARLIRPISARHIDNEVLASACRRLTVRHLVGLISPAIDGGFILPLELLPFAEKTFEEVIYLLQQPCEDTPEESET